LVGGKNMDAAAAPRHAASPSGRWRLHTHLPGRRAALAARQAGAASAAAPQWHVSRAKAIQKMLLGLLKHQA